VDEATNFANAVTAWRCQKRFDRWVPLQQKTAREVLRNSAQVLAMKLGYGRNEEAIVQTAMTFQTGRLAAIAFSLALSQAVAPAASAASATASGPSALALASVIALHSAVLGSFGRRSMARLFAGNSNMSWPPNNKIFVTADSVICRVSSVDIVARSCDLTFRGAKRTLSAREANELYATLAVAGVAAEGAAGSMTESITKL
jgi:hypothetical protein